MGIAKCPACTKDIQLSKETKVHDLIDCPHCNSLLEFGSQYPPTLDWADDPIVYPSRRSMKQIN
jgi:hypothetical protein